MELVIYSPTEDEALQQIKFNKEDLKKELQIKLDKYNGLVYTDNEIKIAKSDRAKLNKFKNALENKRKEVKNQCLKPYEIFEADIKEIVSMVETQIHGIDTQVKAYEEKVKEEKKAAITEIYDKCIADLRDILPLKAMWNDKWLNATYKIQNIKEEIFATVEKTVSDLTVIATLNSEFEFQIKDKYIQTLDLSQSLAEKSRLELQKSKLEEFQKTQEAKKNNAPPINDSVKSISAPAPQSQTTIADIQETPLEMIEFRLWVTPEQKQFLRNYILNNKIKFGKVR